MKILIFGASGFIGKKFLEYFKEGNEVTGTDLNPTINEIKKIDALDKNQLSLIFEKTRPEIVLDCIGIPQIALCEKNPELAMKVNFQTAKNIAEYCREYKSKMFFLSSSYVFYPYRNNARETDETIPINEYSKTKVLAEKEILKLNNSVVLRLEFVYGFNGHGMENGILDEFINKPEILLRNPYQIRQPILLEDIARSIEAIVQSDESGIFHLSGLEKISKYEFFKKVAESFGDKAPKLTISYEENKTPITEITLDNTKIKKYVSLTPLKESILFLKSLMGGI